MFKSKKKHWIIATVVFLLVVVLLSSIFLYDQGRDKSDDPVSGDHKTLMEKKNQMYFENSGWKTEINDEYVQRNPSFPIEFINLSSKNDKISLIKEVVEQQSDIGTFIDNLNSYKFLNFTKNQYEPFVEYSLESKNDLINSEININPVGSFGRTILYIISEDAKIKGAIINEADFIEAKNKEEYEDFLNNYEKYLGSPQLEYVDEVYEFNGKNFKISFYFDKGLAFFNNFPEADSKSLIIFEPGSQIDENFAKDIGKYYVRGNYGCPYCIK